MNKLKNVFLTGITGFLGSFLAKELLDKGYNIYALARPKEGKSAKERVIDALRFVYEDKWNSKMINSKLKIIDGDIVYPDLGIKNQKMKECLISEIDIIFHSAALTDLNMSLDIARTVNVEGTRNVLNFALGCQKLQKVNHISTIFVCGDYNGIFEEDDLDVGQKFDNNYEQTKFEAETLANTYINERFNVSIFRPSFIIGDSKTGKINNFRVFYQPLHYFSKGIFDNYPLNLESFWNLINIDTTSYAIAILGERKESCVYHITSTQDINLRFFIEFASDYFGFKMPRFTPMEDFNFGEWSIMQKLLAEHHIRYFNFKTKITSIKTHLILEEYNFKYPEINKKNLINIFTYCVNKGFIKKRYG